MKLFVKGFPWCDLQLQGPDSPVVVDGCVAWTGADFGFREVDHPGAVLQVALS